MTDKEKKGFSYWKIIVPVLLGLTVVVLMFIRDARKENMADVWNSVNFSFNTWIFIVIAWVFMLGRDLGLSWRFRIITNRDLRWKQAIKVSYLCEFTSCVTPSVVGGSSLGMLFMNQEGIEIGRATTLMITTLFLDELFYVVSCPIVALITPAGQLFASGDMAFSQGLQWTFWLVYAGITAWTTILFIGLLIRPQAIRHFLCSIFSLRFLRRWQPKIAELGDNMVATSGDLKKKSFRFWITAFSATAMTWISRFLVVNALFMAFMPQVLPEQWTIFVRQFVVWVVLMVSPTPGGSGLGEWLFTEYYSNIVMSAGLALIIAVFWRLISYYVYLAIGVCIIPKWIKETYSRISNK